MSNDKAVPSLKRQFKNAHDEACYLEMIATFTGRVYNVPRKLSKRWARQRGGKVFVKGVPHTPRNLTAI